MKLRLISVLILLGLLMSGVSAQQPTFTRMDALTAADTAVTNAATTTLDLATLMGISTAEIGALRPEIQVSVVTDDTSTAYTDVLTFVTVAAADTITFRFGTMNAVVTLTGHDAPTPPLQFDTSGTNEADAQAFAAAFNAHPTLSAYATASGAAAVITLTALQPGNYGSAVSQVVAAGPTGLVEVETAGVNGVDVVDRVSVLNSATSGPAATQGSTAAVTGAVVEDGHSITLRPLTRYLHLRCTAGSGAAVVNVVRTK